MKQVRFNLALVRSARGLTLRRVALATGLSKKTLNALETGASKEIEFLTLAKLCDFLKCTPNDLLLIENEDMQPSTESSIKAGVIITKGFERAMNAPKKAPEEIWAKFDDLRAKIQATQQKDLS